MEYAPVVLFWTAFATYLTWIVFRFYHHYSWGKIKFTLWILLIVLMVIIGVWLAQKAETKYGTLNVVRFIMIVTVIAAFASLIPRSFIWKKESREKKESPDQLEFWERKS